MARFSKPEDFVVNKLQLDIKLLKNKSIVLYGLSDTGKTTITKDIMHILKDEIQQVVVVNKNEESNRAYEGMVPQAFVHKNLTSDLIKQIWERQGALVAVYNQANTYKHIESLYLRVRDDRFDQTINDIKTLHEASIKNLRLNSAGDNETEIEGIREKCNSYCVTVMKKRIRDVISNFNHMTNLSEDEKFSLKYFSLNPEILFIVDDCIEDVKKLHKDENWNQMFTAGRHRKITFLVLLQDDVPLTPEQKKNTAVNIFTSSQIANVYFERASNGFSKEQKLLSVEACKMTFTDNEKHQKLLYHRSSGKYFKITATLRGKFQMCPQFMWDYSDNISIDKKNIGSTNRHFRYFNT